MTLRELVRRETGVIQRECLWSRRNLASEASIHAEFNCVSPFRSLKTRWNWVKDKKKKKKRVVQRAYQWYILHHVSLKTKRETQIAASKLLSVGKTKCKTFSKFRVILEMGGHHDYPSACNYLILYFFFCFGLILVVSAHALLSYLPTSHGATHSPTTMTRRWCLQSLCIKKNIIMAVTNEIKWLCCFQSHYQHH